MKNLEQVIREQITDLLNKYCCAAYNEMYSSASYTEEMSAYRHMIAPLITISELEGIDISDISGSYCGLTRNARDFSNISEIIKWF